MWSRTLYRLGVSLLIVAVAVVASEGETHKLPAPEESGEISVEAAIAMRRSVRSYTADPLSDSDLGQILWSAQGITDDRRGLRAAPSAGALYPLEVYVATGDGVWRYIPRGHALETVKEGNIRTKLAVAAFKQQWIAKAPAIIIVAGVYERTARKYGGRAERYVHIEAGCALENIALQAVSLGLGSCPVGAFDDEAVARLAGMRKGERPLIIVPVGKPAAE